MIQRALGYCEVLRPGCTQRATEVDHRIPVNKGGAEAMSNYQAACKSCNSGKGNR